jgi:hypothetical protein
MNLESRIEVYRVAFESAKSELIEISAEFEKLRLRKEQMEKLVAVLAPLLGEGLAAHQGSQEESTSQPAESAVEASSEPNDGPEKLIGDPFQRRIDHVLGIGAGIRDVRKYSRQF